MPSKTLKQRAFMKRAATDPAFAKARDVPQSVAHEFRTADLKKMRRKHNVHHLNARSHGSER